MNRLFSAICLMGFVAVGCQQTQEADEPDTTVIKEKETVIKEPKEDETSTDVKMDVKTDSGGASAQVKVESDSQ